MKNILIIHGNPVKDSFTDQLTHAYINASIAAGAQVKELVLSELRFDPNFHEGYKGKQEPEPDLIRSQEYISWADHLVFFYPNWWSTYPAQLKGFVDRTFLPGFAFSYVKDRRHHVKLLKGKTARLVVTMDSPVWYYYLVQRAPGHFAMRKGVLEFCGIKPVRISSIGSMRKSTEKQRFRWIQKMEAYGRKMT
ncbi:MAG: NAD(P)H-dependent oxidoreductase [Bacteroidales bacterium]|nr:NAD(P)H-dependent oxidoreductase [Bacteroidales bacterium]